MVAGVPNPLDLVAQLDVDRGGGKDIAAGADSDCKSLREQALGQEDRKGAPEQGKPCR